MTLIIFSFLNFIFLITIYMLVYNCYQQIKKRESGLKYRRKHSSYQPYIKYVFIRSEEEEVSDEEDTPSVYSKHSEELPKRKMDNDLKKFKHVEEEEEEDNNEYEDYEYYKN